MSELKFTHLTSDQRPPNGEQPLWLQLAKSLHSLKESLNGTVPFVSLLLFTQVSSENIFVIFVSNQKHIHKIVESATPLKFL